MSGRRAFKIIAAVAALAVFTCTACTGSREKQQPVSADETENQDEAKNREETKNEEEKQKTMEITIPGSLFTFSGTDTVENMEEFSAYCTDVRQEGEDLVLEVTQEQKEALTARNRENMDEILSEVQEADPEYAVELSEDYSEAVYQYDENIDSNLQAKLLLSMTTIYALNGIIETGDADWSVRVSIVNCHTGKTVAQVTLPEETITFGQSEWQESYE